MAVVRHSDEDVDKIMDMGAYIHHHSVEHALEPRIVGTIKKHKTLLGLLAAGATTLILILIKSKKKK